MCIHGANCHNSLIFLLNFNCHRKGFSSTNHGKHFFLLVLANMVFYYLFFVTVLGGSCKNGAFLCDNNQCVAPGSKCNGTVECRDGSDESSKTCDECKAFFQTCVRLKNDQILSYILSVSKLIRQMR